MIFIVNIFLIKYLLKNKSEFLAMTDETGLTTHPFYDVLSTTSYEKEVVKYLLSLEARFVSENDKLRSAKRLRESTNNLKPVQGIPIPGSNSTVLITPKVRCKLIDWIISVHDYHRLNAGKYQSIENTINDYVFSYSLSNYSFD
jgi:hypothetical protein